MARVQLLVDESLGVPWLCILAGPSYRDLLAALEALPRRTYVAPYFWIVDRDGLGRLRTMGFQVVAGSLNPGLATVAHRMTRRMARNRLHTWTAYSLDSYTPGLN